MADITFSVPLWEKEYIAMYRLLLDEFEKQSRIHVELLELPLATEKAEINRIALYHHGPDVSHLGTTWVHDLAAMQALRPFSPAEIRGFGGSEAFIAGSWQSCRLANDPSIWAVPFFVEAVMINYRKDLFEQAEVDPFCAFRSLADLNQAAQQLRHAGVDVPVELPPANAWNLLHAVSGWVWSSGCEYCSPDGHEIWFDRPGVIQSIGEYFSLLRVMSDQGRALYAEQGGSLFRHGKSAVALEPFSSRPPKDQLPAGLWENWYAAPYPLYDHLGGQDLVIWKHTRHEEAALELVAYLTSEPVLRHILQQQGHLSARVGSYLDPGIERDPVFDAQVESIRRGRTYPPITLWGMIEDRLLHTLGQIQTMLLADPSLDVYETTRKFLEPLAKRLNITLGSSL